VQFGPLMPLFNAHSRMAAASLRSMMPLPALYGQWSAVLSDW
jgi:hypothetical protein